MKQKVRNIKAIMLAALIAFLAVVGLVGEAFASAYITVSPPKQKISLVPGTTTKGTFIISSPSNSSENAEYNITVSPFTIDSKDNSAVYESNGDYNKIVDWIKLEWDHGIIHPNETIEVRFTIDTPSDAPAGGQYASIMVGLVNENEESNAVNIKNKYQIAHLVYADVAGETVQGGDISNVSVPSLMFSGNITASATITNTGNVHANAVHVLKVLPLFGDEEFYTNEESPEETLVMPEATRYTSVSWNETPSMGIFRVNYKVNFEGVEKEISKVVIICPLWLMFIVVMIIVLIVIKFVLGKKKKPE